MNSWDATALRQWIKSGAELSKIDTTANAEDNCMCRMQVERDLASPAHSTARTLPRYPSKDSDPRPAGSDQVSVFLRETTFNCWDISDGLRMHCGRFRDCRTAIRYISREFGAAVRIIVLSPWASFPSAPTQVIDNTSRSREAPEGTSRRSAGPLLGSLL